MSEDKGNLMASTNVAERLEVMESQLRYHDQLHRDNSETLKEVKNVLVRQASISEKILNLDERLEKTEERFDKRFDKLEESIGARLGKMDDRVDNNQKSVYKWSGGLAALMGVVAVLGALAKFS